MVSILIVLACIVLFLYPLLYATVISLLRVSGGTVFLRGFRDSIVLIVLLVLHTLMDVPVLLRVGIFQVTPGTNVSRFSTSVEDNIIYSLLYKNGLGVFNFFRATVVLVSRLSLIVFHIKLMVIIDIYCR